MENVTFFGAFIAGVLSFISPCVLPLIPGYLSFISGVSLEEMRGMPVAVATSGSALSAPSAAGTATVATGISDTARRQVIVTSLFFILGFSLVFIALGASASALGQFLMERLTILGKIAGVLLVIFGLHTIGVFKIQWLLQEKRVHMQSKPAGMIGAMLVGISFAFGWTPCIGPVLGAILAVGAAGTSAGGVGLLSAYALGLGLPFLLAAWFIDSAGRFTLRLRRFGAALQVAGGLVMVLIGVAIMTGRIGVFALWLLGTFPALGRIG